MKRWMLFFADGMEWFLWGFFDTPTEAFAEQTRQRTTAPRLRVRIVSWNPDITPAEFDDELSRIKGLLK